MKKRLLNLFLALALVVCVLPFAASAIEYADDTCTSGNGQHDWEDGYCGMCALPCNHSYDANGECTKCDVVCKHDAYADGSCTACGAECVHSYDTNGECTKCDAVCAHAAYADGSCTVCGAECDHKYENKGYAEGFEATCQYGGYYIYECSVCGNRTKGDAPKLDHTPEVIPATEPTCESTGFTAGEKCSVCGETLVAPEAAGKALKHDHSVFVETVTEPGCTTQGVDLYKCSRCEDTKKTYTDALEHDFVFDRYCVGNEPTCTEAGMAWHACTRCDEEEQKSVAKLGHTTVEIPAVEPTCESAGFTAGEKCSTCEVVLVEPQQTEKALKHDYSVFVENVVASTCTEKGKDLYKCSRCDNAKKFYIDELGHDYVFNRYCVGNEPTCTEDGMAWHVCTRCNKEEKKSAAKLGHTPVEIPAVEPTCESAGFTAGEKCSTCEVVLVEPQETAKALKHDHSVFVETITAPGCTTQGVDLYKCSRCEDTKKSYTDAVDHNFEFLRYSVGSEPTCTTGGVAKYKCTRCAEEENRSVGELGHTPVEIPAVEPTCESVGYTAGEKCSVCEEVLTAPVEADKALKHDYSVFVENVVASTCTEKGKDLYKCSRCEDTKKFYIDELGHNFEFLRYSVGNEPTCTAGGVERYQCTRCEEIEDRSVGALGHTPVEIPAVEPTCVSTGYTAGEKCSVCEEVLTAPEVADKALKHDYSVFVETVEESTCETRGKDLYKCSRCDDTKKFYIDELGHNYEFLRYSVGNEPTCTAGGVERYQCTRCEKMDDRTVGALGHIEVVVEVVREPSCTVYGVTKYACERENCGQTWYVEDESLGHKEEILPAVEPTCTTTGLTEGKKCSVCNEVLTEQEEIREAAHTWKTIEAKAATCAEDGYNAYQECEICGTTQNKEIVKGGHKFENFKCTVCGIRDTACEHKNAKITVTESTCTVAGTKSFECEDCGYKFEEELALKEHTEVDKSYAATCTKKGLTHKVCGVCGKDLVKQEIATVAHTEVDKSYAATCTKKGLNHKVCGVCGIDIVKKEIATTAHNYVNNACSVCGAAKAHSCRWFRTRTETVKAATCTETGLQNVICTTCGYITETRVVGTTSHKTTTETVKNATCTEAGQQKETCTVCGHVSFKEIAKIAHKYMNGVCSGCNQGDPNKVTTDLQDFFLVG